MALSAKELRRRIVAAAALHGLGMRDLRTALVDYGANATLAEHAGTIGLKDYRDAQYSNVKFLSEEFGLESLKTRNGWESDILGTHAVAEVEARKDTEAPLGLD